MQELCESPPLVNRFFVFALIYELGNQEGCVYNSGIFSCLQLCPINLLQVCFDLFSPQYLPAALVNLFIQISLFIRK